MRKVLGFIVLSALAVACGSSPDAGDASSSSEGALASRVPSVTASQVNALAPGQSLKVDLSRPGAAVKIDVSKGKVDLSRVEVVVAGRMASAQSLEKNASSVAGFTPAYGSFYLVSGASSALRYPGEPKCSPLTQTDCCECGWQSGGICLGFWCPCTGDECGGVPVFAP